MKPKTLCTGKDTTKTYREESNMTISARTHHNSATIHVWLPLPLRGKISKAPLMHRSSNLQIEGCIIYHRVRATAISAAIFITSHVEEWISNGVGSLRWGNKSLPGSQFWCTCVQIWDNDRICLLFNMATVKLSEFEFNTELVLNKFL